MKFFKHYCDATDGQSIQALMDEFGHMGLTYWILVESCAGKLGEKLEQKGPGGRVLAQDCDFTFNEKTLRRRMRVNSGNFRKILEFCAGLDLLSCEFSGNKVRIVMPKVLKILERGTKKPVKMTSPRRTGDVPEEELELEIEEEKETTTKNLETAKTEQLPIVDEFVALQQLFDPKLDQKSSVVVGTVFKKTEEDPPDPPKTSPLPDQNAVRSAQFETVIEKYDPVWAKVYPDQEFRSQGAKAAFLYWVRNPRCPSTMEQWAKVIESWLSKNWKSAQPENSEWLTEADILVQAVKKIPSQPAQGEPSIRDFLGPARFRLFSSIGRSRIAMMPDTLASRKELANLIRAAAEGERSSAIAPIH